MRNTLAAVFAVGVLASTLASAEAPVGTGKVYAGSEGESVAVIPLTTKGPKGEKQVLLSIQGTDTEFDGKPLPHTVYEQSRGADYVTQYKGNDFYTLVVREAYGSGSKKYELFVPGHRDAIIVSYDEKRTQALKSEDAYAQYQKLQKDGTLAKLAAFNRKERESGQQEGFAPVLKGMNDACGTSVTATIDWKSISDEVIKKYSVASYCGNPLDALRKLCDSAAGKKAIQAKVKKYACQFGSELKLDVKAGQVSFTTQQDAANQEEFATQYFEKNL
jgi:hypothetical protein